MLNHSNYEWTIHRHFKSIGYWHPQLPPSSPEYRVKVPDQTEGSHHMRKLEKLANHNRLKDTAWGALGEVISMAEGRDGVSLGRVRFIRKLKEP